MIARRPFPTLLVVVAIGLLVWVGWSVRALEQAREARDAARAGLAGAAPGTGVAAGAAIGARDEAAARAAVAAWIGDRAVAAGVRVSLTPLAAATTDAARLRLAARADEAALRRFVRAIEAPGVIHADRWSLAAQGAVVVMRADLRVAWRPDGAARLVAGALPAGGTAGSERALFAADGVADAAPAAGDVPELVGIFGRLPDASAIVRMGDGTTRVLARGAVADGWRVVAVAADRVSLSKGKRVQVVVLPPTSR